MPVQPVTKVGRIEFCEEHIDQWTANAVPMGSSAPTVSSWSVKVAAARAAYQAQRTAMIAAKDATIEFNLAVQAMTQATSEIIKQVGAKATMGGDAIYALAGIPAPSTPAPRQPPGMPYEPKVGLDLSGALSLGWKCNNPPGTSGTMYQVYRRAGLSGSFVLLGGSGERKFTDDTIPSGATQLTYKIQGVRSTCVGPWAEFNVSFGTNANGVMFASLAATPAKLAA